MNSHLGLSDLNFGKMVRQALDKAPDAAVHEHSVPDVYVGQLQDLPLMLPASDLGRWWAADTETARSARPAAKCMVIVLESPHVDEYDATHCYTPWPANGTTGENIQSRVLELAELLSVPLEVGLILFNAIPYQCSQGNSGSAKEWKARRDKIFSHAWKQDATRSFFRARLKGWVLPGDIVVNCCTAGLKCKPPLRDLVETEIVSLLGDTVKRVRMHHPSSWIKRKPLSECLILAEASSKN